MPRRKANARQRPDHRHARMPVETGPDRRLTAHAQVREHASAGWTREGGVAELRRRDLIDRNAEQACERLYAAWAIGVMGVRSPGNSTGSDLTREESRLVQAARYRAVGAALGVWCLTVLTALACEGLSLSALERRYRVTAAETAELCRALQGHFGC